MYIHYCRYHFVLMKIIKLMGNYKYLNGFRSQFVDLLKVGNIKFWELEGPLSKQYILIQSIIIWYTSWIFFVCYLQLNLRFSGRGAVPIESLFTITLCRFHFLSSPHWFVCNLPSRMPLRYWIIDEIVNLIISYNAIFLYGLTYK